MKKTVGIRDLKNNLSRYLREVREGETFWIKDRNRVIAEIHRPGPDAPERLSRLESWLETEERKGRLRRARVGDASLEESWRKARASAESLDLTDILDEIRSDRV